MFQNMNRRPRSLLLPFAAGHFANDLAPVSVLMLAPAIALDLELSTTEVGLLIAIQSWGAALGFLPSGMLADVVSNRGRLMLITFWWVAVGHWFASFAPGFWWLAVLLALAGFGDAAWHPLATTILVQNDPQRRAQALGIHAIGGTLSGVIGPLLVGFLLTITDWRQTLQIIALPGALMGVAFFVIAKWIPVQQTTGKVSRADFSALAQTWFNGRGLRIIAMISTYHMALVAMISMIPLYLQEFHGFSSSETGIAYAVMVLAGAIGQPFIGRLSDRVGRRKVIVLGNGLAAAAAFSVRFFEQEGWLFAILGALLIGVALLECVRSAILAAAVEYAGSREGATLGFAFSLMDGIGAFGAVLAGWVASFYFSNAFLLAGGLALLAVLACFTVSLQATAAPEATSRHGFDDKMNEDGRNLSVTNTVRE
jgi:predicted MFS family arabinose efflux permease